MDLWISSCTIGKRGRRPGCLCPAQGCRATAIRIVLHPSRTTGATWRFIPMQATLFPMIRMDVEIYSSMTGRADRLNACRWRRVSRRPFVRFLLKRIILILIRELRGAGRGHGEVWEARTFEDITPCPYEGLQACELFAGLGSMMIPGNKPQSGWGRLPSRPWQPGNPASGAGAFGDQGVIHAELLADLLVDLFEVGDGGLLGMGIFHDGGGILRLSLDVF